MMKTTIEKLREQVDIAEAKISRQYRIELARRKKAEKQRLQKWNNDLNKLQTKINKLIEMRDKLRSQGGVRGYIK